MSRFDYQDIYKNVDLNSVFNHYGITYKESHSQKGMQFVCCCPFPNHEDNTPSFSMNKDTGIYNCFSKCGGGNFIQFVQKMENLTSYKAAEEWVKQKITGQASKKLNSFDKIKNNLKRLERQKENKEEPKSVVLKEYVLPKSDPAEKHLSIVKKRVSIQSIKKWGMRYCVEDEIYRGKCDGRLIIPVYFEQKLVTFAARDMTGKADAWNKMKKEAKANGATPNEIKKLSVKYLHKKIWYPFGTPMAQIFFNWDNVKKGGSVIVCEGIISCIAIVNFGYNVLAILSCQLSDYKVGLLLKNFDTIFIALDNDDKVDGDGNKYNPGQAAAHKILDEKLDSGGVEVHNIVLPEGKDPDECTKDEFDRCYLASQKIFKKKLAF